MTVPKWRHQSLPDNRLHISASVVAGGTVAGAIAAISIAGPAIHGLAFQATYVISITYVVTAIAVGLLLGSVNAVGAIAGLSVVRHLAWPTRARPWAAAGGSFLTSAIASYLVVVPAVHAARGGRWSDIDDPAYLSVVLVVAAIGAIGTAVLQGLREASRI